ncbi:MAG TPA: hypothetical protein VK517_19940 [Cyclobacteriaceae bacterium]|nr:hypothetical protein [Cyclobacteriaceae bacterium]
MKFKEFFRNYHSVCYLETKIIKAKKERMKPSKFPMVFALILITGVLILNSSGKKRATPNVQDDTTSVSYWKKRARDFEHLAVLRQQNLNSQSRIAEQKTKEAQVSKKLYDESKAKIEELNSLLEQCKKEKH